MRATMLGGLGVLALGLNLALGGAFTPVASAASGMSTIGNAGGSCLEDDGASALAQPCTGANNQKWYFTSPGKVQSVTSGNWVHARQNGFGLGDNSGATVFSYPGAAGGHTMQAGNGLYVNWSGGGGTVPYLGTNVDTTYVFTQVNAAARHNVTKSYLMDEQGTVASPASGSIYAGEALNQMTTGAWQIKFVPRWGGLCLVNSSSWCVRDASGVPKMIQVSVPIHKSWVWSEHVRTNGGINFQNADGGYLCALGGTGSGDVVAPSLGECPGGASYDRWFFNGTTVKGSS